MERYGGGIPFDQCQGFGKEKVNLITTIVLATAIVDATVYVMVENAHLGSR